MEKIILDTNFLMIPGQFKVDIFSEIERICNFNYKICIYEGSIRELENIIKTSNVKDRMAATLALKILKSKKLHILEGKNVDVDSLILESTDKDTIIATQDMKLKRKLLEMGTDIIILRQKKYLELIRRKLYK